MKRAVIFDMDGVLVDSEVIVTRIEADMLRELGADISVQEIVANFTGMSDAHMAEVLRRDWAVELPDDFDTVRRARTFASFETDLEAVSGIGGLLDTLRSRDIAMAVASSSAPDRITHSLSLTRLTGYFGDHLYSSTMVARGKPAPDIFEYAVDRLGVEPTQCVVVEDSPLGVQAGLAAGMTVIGFTAAGHCGPDHAERLRAAGAHEIAENAGALSHYLCV